VAGTLLLQPLRPLEGVDLGTDAYRGQVSLYHLGGADRGGYLGGWHDRHGEAVSVAGLGKELPRTLDVLLVGRVTEAPRGVRRDGVLGGLGVAELGSLHDVAAVDRVGDRLPHRWLGERALG